MENLYQDALKTHYLNPIGLDEPICASHCSEGYNASCGDEVTILLDINPTGTLVNSIAFENDSCAICTASASLLCQFAVGKELKSIISCYQYLQKSLNKKDISKPDNQWFDSNTSPEIACLLSISAHPSRINCALLPWQTAIEAFDTPYIRPRDENSYA